MERDVETRTKPARPYLALVPLCAGFFLIMMDTTIVNVALPTMQRDLPASLNQAVWVNSAYLLSYAVPLLLAGRLGDWFGRKPMFLTGMVVFTASSLWCGLSTSAEMLIVARAVQGLGAAAMAPQTMAFITSLFPPDRRGMPIGIWGGIGAVAAAAAPVFGGVLLDVAGWQWIFIVNVPIGVAGLVMGMRVLPGGRSQPGRQRVDVLGAVLSGLGLLILVFCLQNGQEYGWGRIAGTISISELLAVGVVLLTGFVVWQHHCPAEPLVPPGLFSNRNFTAANLIVAAIGFALTGMLLPLLMYLQSDLGLSPVASGLVTMPQALAAGVVGPLAGGLSDRVSARSVIMTGILGFAAGLSIIALGGGASTGHWTVTVAVVLCGIGTGCVFSPLVNVGLRDVPPALMGSASGVYNTSRQVGCVVGSAAVGVLLQAQVSTQPTFGDAVRATLWLPVAVLLAALLLSFAMTDRKPRSEQSTDIPGVGERALTVAAGEPRR